MKNLIFLLFILIISKNCFSETFIVTTKADSGPNSLRDAITKASSNGTAEKDLISFNLIGSSESDRTITLLSPLPPLTSNLVIDATTQPSASLGASTSKIVINTNQNVYTTDFDISYGYIFLLKNIQDVEIYGFYLPDFQKANTIYSNFRKDGTSFYILSSKNITIGAPGKGNILRNNAYGIIANQDITKIECDNIKIQSNWFGLYPTGNVTTVNGSGYGILINSSNSIIGGATKEFGNLFCGYFVSGISGKIETVRNNKFGIDHFENIGAVIRLYVTSNPLYFNDNEANKFYLDFVNAKNFEMLRNVEKSPSGNTRIEVLGCENGIIGSDDEKDMNYFSPNNKSQLLYAGNSKNIALKKNEIKCAFPVYIFNDQTTPEIRVLINNDTEYSGIATPNSEIFIYTDNTDCEICSPVEFYTKTTTSSDGKWKITGDFKNYKFVSNATLLNSSSAYTQPNYLAGRSGSYESTINPSCYQNDGSIKLLNVFHETEVLWYNEKDEKVAEGIEAKGLGPGSYYAKIFNGKCFLKTRNIFLFYSEPVIFTQNIKIVQPSCGLNNGSIKGLSYSVIDYMGLTYKWINEKNEVITTTSTELSNVPPGSYTFIVKTARNCEKIYGPIKLSNSGAPIIDETKLSINPAGCNSATGNISGLSATGNGNLIYEWRNEKNEIVSNALNLSNATTGKYILGVKDAGLCGYSYSSMIEIPEINGITINEQEIVITNTKCNTSNGNIKGIKISGADKYEWFNENNEIVGNKQDLLLVSAGRYKLKISNSTCEKYSKLYTVENISSTKDYTSSQISKNAFCDLANGTIELVFNKDIPSSLRWLDENGNFLGDKTKLGNIKGGEYNLYITDDTGCEKFYQKYNILDIKLLSIDDSNVRIIQDKCDLAKGSITGFIVDNGTPPYSFEWTVNRTTLVTRDKDLINVKSGYYNLIVKDLNGCQISSKEYFISNQEEVLATPVIPSVQICAPGDALISVFNPTQKLYKLYENIYSNEPIQTSSDGKFLVSVDDDKNYYITSSNGNCESDKTLANVNISLNDIKIPDVFTPNNDGANDTWNITGLESYPEATIDVYNRNGQIIYNGKGLTNLFNGERNGKTLPDGTYYYIISLRKGCDYLRGSVTIIR